MKPIKIQDLKIVDDRDLISQIAKGNEHAFITLYDRYSNRVYTLALHILPRAASTATTVPLKIEESTPTAELAETPSLAATKTPFAVIANDLLVNSQTAANGDILISLVAAEKAGWVAIFTDNNSQPGSLLGYSAVPAGSSEDVKVTIDPSKASSKMIALLLVDEGAMGTFEYPGADVAATQSGGNVMVAFDKLTAQ